jgi:DNA invertase Pin-like site-specific DNA recombinase
MRQKKRVVAYVRVSTLEQKKHGYGIEIQVRDVTLYAERHGLFVERFYRDEGESGVKEYRRALQALLRACRKGFVSTVILPSLDRLSRQVRIAENLFHEFQTLGITVLIADMPHYRGDRKDILIRQILEAVAEDNRREIIDRLLKGREARVRRGLFPGGTLPYGYCRNGNSIVVDPIESEIVRRIYAFRRRGLSGQAIADALNEGGAIRRNGKAWTQRQVASILGRVELYRDGFVRYGESRGKSEETILRAA